MQETTATGVNVEGVPAARSFVTLRRAMRSDAIDLYDRDAVKELARYIRDMLLSKGAA